MSRSGNTGATIMINPIEIQAQLDAEKELLADFKGHTKCACTRCASVFQLKDEGQDHLLLTELDLNGCPYCNGLKYTTKQLNTHLPTNFQVGTEVIETLRVPNQSFKRARTLNGKWLDAKPKASKGPHTMGKKPESQKLNY